MINSRSPFFARYRWKELGLLIIPFLILMVGMIQLLLVQNNVDTRSTFNAKYLPPVQALIPIFGFVGVLLIANLVMSIRFRKADQVLLPLSGLLTGIGVLMATRLGPDLTPANPNLGSRQLLFAFVSVAVCLLTIFFLRDTSILSRYKYTWAIASLAFMIPSFISGILTFHSTDTAPTHDQISLGLVTLQPSEFLKITIVIFFAGYLSENREILSQGYLSLGKLRLPPLRQLGPMVLMLLVALMFFLVVRELGIALLIYGLFLCLTYLGSGKKRYVLAYLGIFILFGLIGYSLLNYVKLRFVTLSIDVVNWPAGSDQLYYQSGLQVVQGLIALASGGILGAGLGQGHPWLVPVASTDMVWSALGEELGLAGMMAIIGIYLFIIYRGFRIAIEASDPFNQLLAAGLTSIFAIQTLLIAAGNMKFIPLTGMPLPFLSAGGSSLFTNFIIIGILLRISYNNALEREGLA
jgi:cell division protein FtsW (lipid II flippase)